MVFITAEIGINHNGSIDIAKKLIDAAKAAGCDAVKFQKRTIEKVYSKEILDSPRDSPWGKTTRDQKMALEFDKKEYDEINRYCNENKIEWYASAWDRESQKFLQQYNMKYNKIASPMLTHYELLQLVAVEKKHTFISTGMSTIEEIEKAVDVFRKADCPFELLHANSSYPMKIEVAESLLLKNNLIKGGTLQDLDNMGLNHNIIQGLRAHHLFIKDKDYIIKDKSVVIIDDLSGRPMEGRRYGDGLHQAIEAKEGLMIQKENQTIASITYQNFFRTYKKLSGMTGTATTEAAEFEGIYNLQVVEIPPNLPINRNDREDQIYMTKKEKYDAVLQLVLERHQIKQPILIGTTSVENSEILSKLLLKNNIKHNVLNAKVHDQEAETILQAGMPSNVTISTNMAGRGTDIKLGGDDDLSAKNKEISIKAGGLLVIGTERHESRRIDNQLRGRSGRQGDIGESVFFLSLEDDLMRIFGSKTLENVLSKLGVKEGEVITHSLITKALERAQQKVESHNFDIRKQILKFDDILNDQRKLIYNNRKEILATNDQSEIVQDIIKDFVSDIILECIPPKKYSHEWKRYPSTKKK